MTTIEASSHLHNRLQIPKSINRDKTRIKLNIISMFIQINHNNDALRYASNNNNEQSTLKYMRCCVLLRKNNNHIHYNGKLLQEYS